MKKRQAFEVIAEIEAEWKKRAGCMLWSWSLDHIAFLIKRWQWNKPQDGDRIKAVSLHFSEYAKVRMQNNMSPAWFYVLKDLIRELMQGAGLQTPEPESPKVEESETLTIPCREMELVEAMRGQS